MADEGAVLPDYELLELLLFHSIPRQDVKPLAKTLIQRFGSLGGVLAASPERLAEQPSIKESTVVLLKVVRQAAMRLGREEVIERSVLTSWDALLTYCRATMADEDTERFRVLFLNRKNVLIADEIQQKGTVDHTPVYPREVVKRALELGATALILVHNHPSGDSEPSRADVDMTRAVRDACSGVGVVLHDHVIVSKAGHVSFKSMGLL